MPEWNFFGVHWAGRKALVIYNPYSLNIIQTKKAIPSFFCASEMSRDDGTNQFLENLTVFSKLEGLKITTIVQQL